MIHVSSVFVVRIIVWRRVQKYAFFKTLAIGPAKRMQNRRANPCYFIDTLCKYFICTSAPLADEVER